MIFECDGIEYDTDDLETLSLQDPYVLAVYATRDHATIFAAIMQAPLGVVIRRFDGESLRLLALRTGHPLLLKAAAVNGHSYQPPDSHSAGQ